MTFRNSILVNGVLSSLEATNFLHQSHLETLEKCDIYLMSKLFLPGFSCPSVSFFLETGSLPLRFILMGRRIMFHFQILKKKNNKELVSIISNIQRDHPLPNDWILLVQNDLSQLDLPLSESVIKSFSKDGFKSLVKTRLKNLAFKYLIDKRSSKTNNLQEFKFQEYLSSKMLTLKQKRLLFKFRIRMIGDIRDNFKHMFKNNMNCPLCDYYSDSSHYDDQPSLLTCPVILLNKQLKKQIENITYSDIF